MAQAGPTPWQPEAGPLTVLDTDLLIALERRHAGATALVERLLAEGDVLRIPAVAWLEYLAGVNLAQRGEAEAVLESVCVFEPLGRKEVTQALATHAALAARGRPLGALDLQIAATALARGDALASNDAAFRNVPGLKVLPF